MLSSHTGSFLLYLVWELRSHPFYLIKSLCNCTSAAPMSSVPSVKRSTQTEKLGGVPCNLHAGLETSFASHGHHFRRLGNLVREISLGDVSSSHISSYPP